VVITYLSGLVLQGSIARVPGTDPVTGTTYPAGIRSFLNQGPGHTYRTENVNNATVSSTNHPMQIGLTSGRNLRIDRAGIEALDNGVAEELWLNVETDGGIRTGDGDIVLGGPITVYDGDVWGTWTPEGGGDGTASWSTRTGWWQRTGKKYEFGIYLVADAAGTGTDFVTLEMPVNIYRGTRQIVGTLNVTALSNAGTGSFTANGCGLSYAGGSANILDRLSCGIDNSQNRDDFIQGQDIIVGTIITLQGWYRAA
jgi:hypothetical protein